MPQGSSAVRPTNGLYLYLYLFLAACMYKAEASQHTKMLMCLNTESVFYLYLSMYTYSELCKSHNTLRRFIAFVTRCSDILMLQRKCRVHTFTSAQFSFMLHKAADSFIFEI